MDSISLPYIDLNIIKFKEIISFNSGYGVIWSGVYIDKPCAIKMVILKTGTYYDKDNNIYIGDENVFNKDLKIPFLHTKFKKKRAMTRTELKKEIINQNNLALLSMSPKIYSYGKSHHIDSIQYGFIVMELLYGSLRDYLLTKKVINESEKILLKNLFIKLHEENKIVHGDLKPANIGVKVDSKGQIKEVLFIDCGTIRYKSEMSNEEFIIKVKSDLKYFKSTSKQF